MQAVSSPSGLSRRSEPPQPAAARQSAAALLRPATSPTLTRVGRCRKCHAARTPSSAFLSLGRTSAELSSLKTHCHQPPGHSLRASDTGERSTSNTMPCVAIFLHTSLVRSRSREGNLNGEFSDGEGRVTGLCTCWRHWRHPSP